MFTEHIIRKSIDVDLTSTNRYHRQIEFNIKKKENFIIESSKRAVCFVKGGKV